jgi:hypothetical protein
MEFAERVGREVCITNMVDLDENGVEILTHKSWYMIK